MTSIDTDQPLSRHLTPLRRGGPVAMRIPARCGNNCRSITDRARKPGAVASITLREGQPTDFQVFLIQSAAAVDSLWPWPGFGQFAGAVMLRIGMLMTRSLSQVMNGYSGLFLLNPV